MTTLLTNHIYEHIYLSTTTTTTTTSVNVVYIYMYIYMNVWISILLFLGSLKTYIWAYICPLFELKILKHIYEDIYGGIKQ